jgi:type IV secretory pathway TraG/TraD family ATPase VirD4
MEQLAKGWVNNFGATVILLAIYIINICVTFFMSIEEYWIDEDRRYIIWLSTIISIIASIVCFSFIQVNLFLYLFALLFCISLGLTIFIRRMYGHVRWIKAIAQFSFDFGQDSFSKHNQMKDDKDMFKRLPYQSKSLPEPTAFNIETKNPSNQYMVFPMLFRHFLIIGGPGAGKSASILKPFMENSIINLKQSSFIYDFKSPELTTLAYHFWIRAKQKYGDEYKHSFKSIDFANPMKSHQCNPLSPNYITSLTFAKQIVEVLYKNLNKGEKEQNDIWSNGAKGYLSASIWHLIKLSKKYKLNLSNFLNLIYFVNSKYSERNIEIMFNDFELQNEMATMYKSRKAENTIGGLLAQTSSSISKLNDKALLFVTLEDKVNLNINDPQDPAILCLSNKGDDGKDVIYSPIISVLTTILFSKVNVKNRLPCSIIIDELPTIVLPNLDKLLNTGRSNKLSIMLAMQAYSQLKTNYGDKEADTIKAGCGSIFYGKVMEPEAAKQANELVGKGEVKKTSQSTGKSSSTTINKEFKDILQVSEAFMLPAGGFGGVSAGGVMDKDMNDQRFLCHFKYIDYHENKLEVFPDQYVFQTSTKDIATEQQFNLMMDKVIQSNIAILENIQLREYWSSILIQVLKDLAVTKDLNLETYIEMCDGLYISDDIEDLEQPVKNLNSQQLAKEAPKVAAAYLNFKFRSDFLKLGIIEQEAETNDSLDFN